MIAVDIFSLVRYLIELTALAPLVHFKTVSEVLASAAHRLIYYMSQHLKPVNIHS